MYFVNAACFFSCSLNVFLCRCLSTNFMFHSRDTTTHLKQQHIYNNKHSYYYVLLPWFFLAMLPDLTDSLDEMDFSIDSETGRLINIANYANKTGYFVLAGLIFIGVLSVYLFINDLKTATKRSGEIPLGYHHRR